MQALYRLTAAEPWQDVEIIAIRSDGLLLREVGRHFCGVWVACPSRVRMPGVVFELRGNGCGGRKAAA